jgi:hypothetical protein
MLQEAQATTQVLNTSAYFAGFPSDGFPVTFFLFIYDTFKWHLPVCEGYHVEHIHVWRELTRRPHA